MKGRNAVIVLGGEFDNHYYFKNRISNFLSNKGLLVGVDSGANHIHDMEIRPNLLVGDFDSISKMVACDFVEVKNIRYSREKDMTDGELAIREVIKRGYADILLLGATGGRFDHYLQNIHLLELADDLGASVSVEATGIVMDLITSNRSILVFEVTKNDVISLIPISSIVEGITTEGLKYSLEDSSLKRNTSRGISNVPQINYANSMVSISIKSGKMLVIKNTF